MTPAAIDAEAINIAARTLQSGGLVAFPTETVYGLGANALDEEAVKRIFAAKGRPASDPIIVHLHHPRQLPIVALDVPPVATTLIQHFWPGPLTLVLRRTPQVPAAVSAGMDTVAVRMPAHPIAQALIKSADCPVAAPSANRFARPSATTAAHVLEDLAGQVDVILDGGPAIIGLESTILDLTRPQPVVLRPGGVPLEDLRAFIPDLEVITKYLQPDETGILAPGMLVKHYSPRAQLLLYEGSSHQIMLTTIHQRAQDLIAANKRVGLLLPDSEIPQFAHLPVATFSLGADLEAISHNLFHGLRTLDSLGVDVILTHTYPAHGLGAALRDRLIRAAEGHLISC